MNSLFSSSIKSGLIALGIVSGITAPSVAGPIMQPSLAIPTSTAAPTVTDVRDSWAGGNNGGNFRFRRSGNWSGHHWNGGRHWNHGGWRHRGGYGGYYDDGAGAAILGLGLGLGSVYNNYNNYDYAPPQRRYYRAGRISNAHVQWCYNRYRSYRSWDNTFQPYNGPRQQCYSPYS